MKKALHIAQKYELWQYIRKLCTIYGEDNKFCTSYAAEVYYAQKENMDDAILCFKSLCEQGRFLDIENRRRERFRDPGLLRG